MKATFYLYGVPACCFADMKPILRRKILCAKALRDEILAKGSLDTLSDFDSTRLNAVIEAIAFNEKLLAED